MVFSRDGFTFFLLYVTLNEKFETKGICKMSVFRDLAKAVHPDVCNHPDATEMMKQVLVNRYNTDALLSLARKWGLKLDGSFDSNAFNEKSFNERSERVFEAVVGSIVRYAFNHKLSTVMIEGVIIKIRSITKGRLAGAKEYSIYNFRDQRIWTHKSFTTPGWTIMGMASESELKAGQEKQDHIKNSKKVYDNLKKINANECFRRYGITPNKNYNALGYEVEIRFRGGYRWCRLIRTTSKCVYIPKFDGSSLQRRISVDYIVGVRRV